jgi:hypothetical protein
MALKVTKTELFVGDAAVPHGLHDPRLKDASGYIQFPVPLFGTRGPAKIDRLPVPPIHLRPAILKRTGARAYHPVTLALGSIIHLSNNLALAIKANQTSRKSTVHLVTKLERAVAKYLYQTHIFPHDY